MAMSGIEMSDEIGPLFNGIKLKSEYKWAIFHIKESKSVQVERLGPAIGAGSLTVEEDSTYFEEVKQILIEGKEPRYVLYDFNFNSEERQIKKLAFLFYSPDSAKIKLKMLYASTKDTVKKLLTGLNVELQANDSGDLDHDSYVQEIKRKSA